MLLQKKSGDGQEFLSRKKLSRKKLSIFVSKVGPATGVSRVRLIRVKLVLVNLSTINDTYSFQNVANERIKPIFPKGSKFEGLSARNSSIQAC